MSGLLDGDQMQITMDACTRTVAAVRRSSAVAARAPRARPIQGAYCVAFLCIDSLPSMKPDVYDKRSAFTEGC